MNCGWRFVTLYKRQGSRPSPRKRNAKKKKKRKKEKSKDVFQYYAFIYYLNFWFFYEYFVSNFSFMEYAHFFFFLLFNFWYQVMLDSHISWENCPIFWWKYLCKICIILKILGKISTVTLSRTAYFSMESYSNSSSYHYGNSLISWICFWQE